jgi:hypothetical protein
MLRAFALALPLLFAGLAPATAEASHWRQSQGYWYYYADDGYTYCYDNGNYYWWDGVAWQFYAPWSTGYNSYSYQPYVYTYSYPYSSSYYPYSYGRSYSYFPSFGLRGHIHIGGGHHHHHHHAHRHHGHHGHRHHGHHGGGHRGGHGGHRGGGHRGR